MIYRIALESYNPETNEITGVIVGREYDSLSAAKSAYGRVASAFKGCNVDCTLEGKTNDPYDTWSPVE